MSVTTTTAEDVSLEVQVSAHGDTRIVSPETRRARATQIAAQRLLLVVPPVALAGFLMVVWYIRTATGDVPSLILPAPLHVFAALSYGLQSRLLLRTVLVTVTELLL